MRLKKKMSLNDPVRSPIGLAKMGLQWLLQNRGPLTVSAGQVGGFARTAHARDARAHIQFKVMPLSVDKPADPLHDYSGFSASACQCRPDSRGRLTIRSTDPFEQPRIEAGYFTEQHDHKVIGAGLEMLREIYRQPAFADLWEAETRPGNTDHFGPLAQTPFIKPLEGHPEMMRMVREPQEEKRLNFGDRRHSDMTVAAEPVLGTCLDARESPAVGGAAIWSNQMLAFDALSSAMQRMREGLKVMHSAKRSYGPQGTYADDDLKSMRIKVSEEALQEQAHPCVRTHPDTGRKFLFVNWVYAIRFEGISEEESAPVLDFLDRHRQRPEFQIRFRWRQGSLARWDKRSTQHIAVNDYPGYRRVMDRVTIVGDTPFFKG